MYRRGGKRLFDLFASALSLLLLLPALLLLALLIRLEDGGPALFVQERVGRRGGRFRMLKLRSMPVRTAQVPKAEADLEVTRLGRFLRRTNADELPQLLNVLRGDMSLVGPRPPLPAQGGLVELRRASGALELRPGLTGLAQLKAYDGMPDAEKARWDALYAQRVTLLGDLGLLFATLGYLRRPPPKY